jgi:ATP-binding cassette subfamily F protein uup
MTLLTLRNISLSYGTQSLFDRANLSINPKERIGLIGRNGTGKSTLLKLIHCEIEFDSGEYEKKPGLVISKLQQDIPRNLTGTIFDNVAAGLGEAGTLLAEHEKIAHEFEHHYSDELFHRLTEVQHKIELAGAWELKQRVETILSKMGLSPEQNVSSLSGGYIRRVLMARAIVTDPDLLLLDEPTNHLDIETIMWLEEFLLSYPKSILFITHDRSLLKKIATRIIDIDQGEFTSWDCDYHNYLIHKEEQIAAESKANALFDKRLAEEERWIRQGVKARRKRNEGRVRRLEDMRQERGERRTRLGNVNIQSQSIDYSGKKVFELEKICYEVGDNLVIDHFSTVVMRGDKIGIIGPNGIGKSTLLKIILQKLAPTEGAVKHGTQLDVSYFDQQREQLNEEKPVFENISDGGDFIMLNGKSTHVMSYLRDFLFTPERARVATKVLSGGERHRLLLARLFTRPSNVLILDEPTNDLDAETLELLEEKLMEYEGTLLLVSHDREFLDNIATSTWVFEGNGQISEYVGGYQDYLRQRPQRDKSEKLKNKHIIEKKSATSASNTLTHKEKTELTSLPNEIERLETVLLEIQTVMADPNFYKNDAEKIKASQQQLHDVQNKLNAAYERWEVLDARRG